MFFLTLTLCACVECIGSWVIWFSWVWPNQQCSTVFIQFETFALQIHHT